MARALQANDVANSAFESAGIQVLRLVARLEHPGDAPAEPDAEVLRRFLEFLNAAHALVTQTAGMAADVFGVFGSRTVSGTRLTVCRTGSSTGR